MKKSKIIYLDYAASVSPNPSSVHSQGSTAKSKLENARSAVAGILGARSSEIIFTSGGTESNNLAILGLIQNFEKHFKLPHIVTTNIEHPSVLHTCDMLRKRKLAEITIVPVEESGIVDPRKIKKALKRNTVLVSVMYANNEIGSIQPIREIAKEIRHYKKTSRMENFPIFHTDAVQAANYLDLKVERLGIDLLTLSGSKIEGAGRVGVLYKKKSVPLVNVFGGGDQEQGLRPGTENLPEILKFSIALVSAQKIKEKETKRLTRLRDYFLAELLRVFSSRGSHAEGEGRRGKKIGEMKLLINGDQKNRLPNNLNITIPNIPSDLLVIELSAKGIMASAKSACKSSQAGSSYVIEALRKEQDPSIGGVRFSMGSLTTKKEINNTVRTLADIVLKLKKWYP